MLYACSHLPRLKEVSALFHCNIRLHFQRVASHVCYRYYAVNGRVFVEEKQVVDDAGERSERVVLVWFTSFIVYHITCKFEIPRHIS